MTKKKTRIKKQEKENISIHKYFICPKSNGDYRIAKFRFSNYSSEGSKFETPLFFISFFKFDKSYSFINVWS